MCHFKVHFDEVGHNLSISDHVQLSPGSGPRHVLRHKAYPLLFVLTELENTLCVFQVGGELKVRSYENI